MNGTSDQRIDIRLPKDTKELIERAAVIEGVSVSAFIIGNATYAAKETISEHEERVARDREKRAFIEVASGATERRTR